MKQSFITFDKDKSGKIDKKELKQVLMSIGDKMTDAEVDDMFNAVDKDNDEQINSDGKT